MVHTMLARRAAAFNTILVRTLMLGACLLVCRSALADEYRYQCSYYLFEAAATVNGCSDCYVVLVITRRPIEAQLDQEAVVITTYERDSIWEFQRRVLKYAESALDPATRRISLGGKAYRYQLVSNTEAIRLLKNPLGTIPIHRISRPKMDDDGASQASLLNDLSVAGEDERCAAGNTR